MSEPRRWRISKGEVVTTASGQEPVDSDWRITQGVVGPDTPPIEVVPESLLNEALEAMEEHRNAAPEDLGAADDELHAVAQRIRQQLGGEA